MKELSKIATLALFFIVAGACTSKEARESTNKSPSVVAPAATMDYQVGDYLPNELVCMVNNAFMGKPQIPVPVNGKTYYGCCNMCVGKLNKDAGARTAVDPLTGEPVDKSEAYIVLSDDQGAINYFTSEGNYKKYSNKLTNKGS